jgi:lipid-binding SYLF domain-containing protein
MASPDPISDTPLSPQSTLFSKTNALGHQVLDELAGEPAGESTRFEGRALNPSTIASARCLVFLRSTRAGCIIGGTRGAGFAIAITHSGAWSPPCFVRLTRWQLGAMFGAEFSSTLLTSVSLKGEADLVEGDVTEFGTNIACQLWPFVRSGSGPDDEISMGTWGDWAVASVGKGALLDFSLGGGSLKVDKAKNLEAYGAAGEDAAGILAGKVPHQQDMVPLYHRVREIGAQALK